MKMLVNCADIWLVDMVQFQDDAALAILFKVPSFEILVGHNRVQNQVTSMEVFLMYWSHSNVAESIPCNLQ